MFSWVYIEWQLCSCVVLVLLCYQRFQLFAFMVFVGSQLFLCVCIELHVLYGVLCLCCMWLQWFTLVYRCCKLSLLVLLLFSGFPLCSVGCYWCGMGFHWCTLVNMVCQLLFMCFLCVVFIEFQWFLMCVELYSLVFQLFLLVFSRYH